MGAQDSRNPQAKATFLERAWTWIHVTFPNARSISAATAGCSSSPSAPRCRRRWPGLTLIFLGWVAFATVNVIFKDRIIAAKDHRYQQMQAAYENRVADLQISYDELNGALVSAEDRFKATADALQAKQNAIAGFLNRANQVQAAVGVRNTAGPAPPSLARLRPCRAACRRGRRWPRPGCGSARRHQCRRCRFLAADGDAGPAQPQPRTARPVKSSLLDHAMQRFAALFHSVTASVHIAAHPVRDIPAAYAQHPALRALAEQTARVSRIGDSETVLMAKTEGALDQGVGNLRNVMRRTGINPDAFARKIAGSEGVGGPEIPLDQVRIEGISDPGFTHAYLSAAAVLDQLNGLSAAMDHVPLTMPVSTASFDRSSGFGARIDPFTGRYAFHPGHRFRRPLGQRGACHRPRNRGVRRQSRRLWQHGGNRPWLTASIPAMAIFPRSACGWGTGSARAPAWAGWVPPDAARGLTSITKSGMMMS